MSFSGSILGGKLEHFFGGDTLLGLKDPRMRHHMTETCQWPQASSSTGSRVQAGRDVLDPPPEVGSRPGGVPALQQKKDKKIKERREEAEQSHIYVDYLLGS